jgi:hypothetical protein
VNAAEHGFAIELHAYQCHVFLDWRELRSTAAQPWDRLCDHLAGGGVPNLDDALIGLELGPLHDALRRLLDPAVVRNLADVSEHATVGPDKQKELDLQREKFIESAWKLSRDFLRDAQSFYREHNASSVALHLTAPAEMEKSFRERLRAAMRIPALESYFPEPWPVAARRVLPSRSPRLTSTAIWGPVLAWSVLELLAESVDAAHPERAALEQFDRLRLREPLGHAFEALEFGADESWRVAARIKVALLIEAKVFVPEPAPLPDQPLTTTPRIPVLSPSLWQDPDVRWLTGVHESKSQSYLVKEPYEELLWWLQLPTLCKLAAATVPSRNAMQEIARNVVEAAKSASAAGYSIDALIELNATAPETDETTRGDG